MDLSFTKDPVWIEKREQEWNERGRTLDPSLTRKELHRVKQYFFTGELLPGDLGSPMGFLKDFPKFDEEGIQYCLQHVITDKITDDDYVGIQSLLSDLKLVPGLSTDEKLRLFTGVFGDTYEPNRLFPYLFRGETDYRLVDLPVNILFNKGTWVNSCIKSPDRKMDLWLKMPNYFLSLFPFVDVRFFDIELDESGIWLNSVTLLHAQMRFQRVLKWIAHPPESFKKLPYQSEVYEYIQIMRSSLDNLNHYPGQLEELWEGIKSGEHDVE